MRRLNGPLLMATGVLDLLYVLVFHSPQLAAIAGDGFFNAVELDPAQFDRETAFWHVAFGTTVLILSGLVYWVQARTGLHLRHLHGRYQHAGAGEQPQRCEGHSWRWPAQPGWSIARTLLRRRGA
jgi:hypothetical protein